MTSKLSALPVNWTGATLGMVATFEMGQAPPGSASNFSGQGTVFVKAGEFGKDYPVVREWTTAPLKYARAGDVLICVVGATAGKLNLGIDCAIGRSVAAIRPKGVVLQKILYRQLQARVASMRAGSTGSAQGVISKEMLAELPIAVPPLGEQQRIADKLDTVLARVDACRDRLTRVAPLLKRFRQSVLAAATSGRLTEDWRTQNDANVWVSTDIQSVADVGTGSTPLRSNADYFAPAGTPWITSGATSQPFVLSAQEFVTAAAIKAHRLKVYPPGTLLVAMYGEGKTRGQVTELRIPAAINQACAAVCVDEGLARVAYVKLALQANYLEMRELAEGGNQPNLNLSKVKEFELKLPNLDEQTEIVHRVETLFAFADRLEARLAHAQTAVDRLTPSLLSKAFRGELVPQDPNDEPASALLARMAAARSAAPLTSRTRSPRAVRPPRAPKDSATMTKSRQDDDVMGQPYLAGHLRRIGTPATAEVLFKVAELPVGDFYKQLAWEVAQGHVKDNQTTLEPGHAAG